jgi:hypothetical protein
MHCKGFDMEIGLIIAEILLTLGYGNFVINTGVGS